MSTINCQTCGSNWIAFGKRFNKDIMILFDNGPEQDVAGWLVSVMSAGLSIGRSLIEAIGLAQLLRYNQNGVQVCQECGEVIEVVFAAMQKIIDRRKHLKDNKPVSYDELLSLCKSIATGRVKTKFEQADKSNDIAKPFASALLFCVNSARIDKRANDVTSYWNQI